MKMEPIECSEMSAFSTQTPGRYPKENAVSNFIAVYHVAERGAPLEVTGETKSGAQRARS